MASELVPPSPAEVSRPPSPERPAGAAIERTKLHDQIVDSLGGRIVRGEFGSAGLLPSEPLLAAELGVSRNALREAVKVLASKGMVEVRPKTGTRILPSSEWSLLDRDVLGWVEGSGQHLSHALALVEFRMIVEPRAAYMAARRATREEAKRIDVACTRLEACVGKPLHVMSEADLAFHRSILDASHNAILIHLGRLIASLMQVQVIATTQEPGLFEQGLRLHRALADAIVRGDPREAEAISRRLVREPYDRLADQLSVNHDIRLE